MIQARKIIAIVVGLALIGFVVGKCVYFVAGVSATFPPIRKYEFSGNVRQFLSGIKYYAVNNPNVTFNITDTTGDKDTGYGIYLNVEIKDGTNDILYNLECEKSNGRSTPTTLIQLISTFNKNNYNEGGYGINGVGVKKMVDEFEKGFLAELKLHQNMSIKPQ